MFLKKQCLEVIFISFHISLPLPISKFLVGGVMKTVLVRLLYFT